MADEKTLTSAGSRRDFIKRASAVAVTAASGACAVNVVSPNTPSPPEEFDVVIIGTGFGAAVVATTLDDAKANVPDAQKPRVLMIERGSFWFTHERPLPDGFDARDDIQYWPAPDNAASLLNFLAVVETNGAIPKNPNSQPLYHYSMFPTVHILTAGGVGGGSLIYSNVSLEPFYDTAAKKYPVIDNWPLKLVPGDYDNARDWMTKKRGKAVPVVTSTPIPAELQTDINIRDLSNLKKANLKTLPEGNYESLYLPRSNAFRRAVDGVDPAWKAKLIKTWQPLPLQVADYDWQTPYGARGVRVCERQGRCVLGCIPGARHTLNKTLIKFWLSKPKHTLRTLTRVTEIRKVGDVYEVLQENVKTGEQRRTRGKVVVVASGVLGTTELLLRSRGTLTFSSKLGKQFSTNGDFSGFVVDIPKVMGGTDNRVFPTRGPINTSHAMFQDGSRYVNVEDAGVPAMFAEVTRATLDVVKSAKPGDPLLGQLLGSMSKLWFKRQFPNLLPNASDPHAFETDAEVISNVFWFNCMGNDEEFGTFDLDRHGRLTLDYPDPGNNPLFKTTRTVMQKLGEAMCGTYVDFPLWNKDLFGTRKLAVTHPLGGCPMGSSATEGAVDTQGRVFKGGGDATAVHPGLYVADGSVIPGSIGVNPTLTIVAVALRIANGIAAAV